jgi:hypothetical protein
VQGQGDVAGYPLRLSGHRISGIDRLVRLYAVGATLLGEKDVGTDDHDGSDPKSLFFEREQREQCTQTEDLSCSRLFACSREFPFGKGTGNGREPH